MTTAPINVRALSLYDLKSYPLFKKAFSQNGDKEGLRLAERAELAYKRMFNYALIGMSVSLGAAYRTYTASTQNEMPIIALYWTVLFTVVVKTEIEGYAHIAKLKQHLNR